MVNRTLLCSLLLALCSVLSAQTVKNVTLSHNVPFTDTPVLKNAPEGTEMTATFGFNEDDNAITVTLQSSGRLFVFWDDIPFRKAFRGSHLRTDRLSYVTTGSTSDLYTKCKRFRRALPKPRCKYVFKRWADAGDLKSVPSEHKMLNDSITLTLLLPDLRTDAAVRLRDILLLNEVKQKGVSRKYELSYAGDINTEYRITLQRNPCLKMEQQIDAADKALTAITRSYQALGKAYPKKTVPRKEDLEMFNELKQALLLQFPANNDSCECERLMTIREQYNQYADSVSAFDVSLDIPIDPLTQKARRLDAKLVLFNARQLDANVSRWLATNDAAERKYLIEQSKNIIADTNKLIETTSAESKEEKDAVNLFQQAAKYFNESCK